MNTMTRRLMMVSAASIAMISGSAMGQAHDPHAGHNHGAGGHVQPSQVTNIQTPTGTPPANITDDLSANAVLTFKDINVSAGEILDTEPAELVYNFKNTGTADLEIRLIKPSCGCTVPELDKKIYKPGEKGEIRVTFDPNGKKGAISRGITVYTNRVLCSRG